MTDEASRTTSAPRFDPPCGPVEGRLDGSVIRAAGIPYAQAARFGKPAPLDDRTTLLAADRRAPACPQNPVPFLDETLGATLGDLPQDEDCLRLSVTCPANGTADERLPVMVWIHGGSYTCGAGDAALFDPAALVAEQRVVVVAVTYRLGLFGYLGDGAERAANLGLLDQICAFRWVRRNIAAFGGDPANVTAFGQSAGGDAIVHIMATPDAERLFDRAIVQSPPLGIRADRAEMSAAMCRATAAATAAAGAAEILPLEAAAQRAAKPYGVRGSMPFGVQYGHDPLPPERDVEAAWRHVAPRIDLVIGHTAEEGRLFLPKVPQLEGLLRVPVLNRLIRWIVGGYVTEAVYGRGVRAFARRHVEAGGRAHRYTLRWSAPGNAFGSAHAIDLPLLFANREAWKGAALLKGAAWSDIDAQGRKLRKLWADFAHGNGLPDEGDAPGLLSFRRQT